MQKNKAMGQALTNRIAWIDNFRGLCALCVLLAHCGHCPSLYLQLYTPFFLSGFFFLSGYCYKSRKIKDALLKIFKSLLIPYFFFAFVINLGRSNIFPMFKGDFSSISLLLTDFLSGIKLWFIPCLIIVQLYFALLNPILQINKKKDSFYIILAILCFTSMLLLRTPTNISRFDYEPALWYWDTGIFALGFFTLGYYIKIRQWSKYLLSGYKAYIALLAYCTIVLLVNKFMNVEFHFITNYYASLPYYIFASLFGIYVMSSVCNTFKAKYLQMLGYNTLLLFALNWHTLVFYNQFCKFEVLLNYLPDYLWSIAISLAQAVLILIISIPINKYIPWIVGKNK